MTRLKERLATPLLIRTTRKLTLTAARRAYHDELRILASTLLAREDLAALRLHTELFVRSQAFSFSRAFSYDPGAPASVLLERSVDTMNLPRRESLRSVVVVTFTYGLSRSAGALNLDSTLHCQGVAPGELLTLVAETCLLPIAPAQQGDGPALTFRGDP